MVQEQNDQQISQLRQLADENGHTKQSEFDRKVIVFNFLQFICTRYVN